jgi:hypothetical protein
MATERNSPWNQEVVLFIHGTGSQSASSEFPADRPAEQRWYQRGSSFWREFDALLRNPAGRAQLPGPDFWREFAEPVRGRKYDHFWWSGANSEQDRREAGARLHKAISRMAERGVGVHLIGHSHGGSVIRHALLMGRLENVLSVSSLGTPFINHGPPPWGWWWLAAALVVLLIAIAPTVEIVHSMHDFTVLPAEPYHWNENLDTRWLSKVSERWTEAIAQEHSPATYVTLPVAIVLAFMFLAAFGRWLWRHGVAHCMRQFRAAPEDEYRRRWNVLFSRHDEAINALILVDRLRLEDLAPRFGGMLWIYDRLVAPLIEQFMTEISRGGALGADIAGDFVVAVSRFPFEPIPVRPLFVERIDRDLLSRADDTAKKAVVALRRSLSEMASQPEAIFSNRDFVGLAIERVISSTNGELVHNQYFDDIGVQSELVRHIREPLADRSGDDWPPPPPADRRGFRRLRVAAVLGAVLLAGLSAASSRWLDQRIDHQEKIKVACKAGLESELLGEICAEKLRQAGFHVAFERTDYSTREIQQRAAAGDLQVFAELTGSLYRRLANPVSLDGAPWIEPAAGELATPFAPWFAQQRSTNQLLARATPGAGLGVASPYLFVVKREGAEPAKGRNERRLFETLLGVGVIEPISYSQQQVWQRKCPTLRVEHQLNFQKFRTWYGDPAGMRVKIGLTSDLVGAEAPLELLLSSITPPPAVSSFARMARQMSLDRLPGPVQILEVSDNKYEQLSDGLVDLIAGDGTDHQLYEDPSFVPLATVGFGEFTPPPTEAVPAPKPQNERELLTDFLLPYEVFPIIFHPRRAQRQAIAAALAAPVVGGNGRLNQTHFALLLGIFEREIKQNRLTGYPRDARREELVRQYWSNLFTTAAPAP